MANTSPSTGRFAQMALGLALEAALAAVPLVAPRAVTQDLFGILTLLVLAIGVMVFAGTYLWRSKEEQSV